MGRLQTVHEKGWRKWDRPGHRYWIGIGAALPPTVTFDRFTVFDTYLNILTYIIKRIHMR